MTGTINGPKKEDLFKTRIRAFIFGFNLIFKQDCKIIKLKVYDN